MLPDSPIEPSLTGVGIGPGDPRQVTLAALDALESADRVAAPSVSAEAVGRAEAVIRQVCPEISVERLVIPIAPQDRAGAASTLYSSAAAAIVTWLDAGESVAFATIGDPHVYSTFSSLKDAVCTRRPRTLIGTVPGIMAFQVLSARSSTPLVRGTGNLTLCSALDDLSPVADALADPARTVVIYKGGRHVPRIAKLAADAGRLGNAVVGELLGMPGERIVPLADACRAPSTYLSTIIFPSRAPHGAEPPAGQ